MRDHPAEGERLRRIAEGVDERRVPHVAVADAADGGRELLGGVLVSLAQLLEQGSAALGLVAPGEGRRPDLLRVDEAVEHQGERRVAVLEPGVLRLGRCRHGPVEVLRGELAGGVEQPVREPEVVFDQAVDQIHGSAPFGTGGNEQSAGRVEVDTVRRR